MKTVSGRYSARENTISPATNLMFNLIFTAYMLACVLPVILVFMVSITDEMSVIKNGYSLIPEKISFLAYEFLFKDAATVTRAYGVTLAVTVVGTLLNVLITAAFAYPLSRNQFPFKRFLSFMVLIPMLFSGGLVPFYLVYVTILNLKNSIFAMILPGVFGGFNVFIMRTYFKSNIPESIIESAFIDGASETRIFFRIVLPLSLPVLATVGFFSFLGYWNDWFNCLLFITNEKLWNIQYIMMKSMRELQYFRAHMQQIGGYAFDELNKIPTEGVRMAMAVVGMVPILAVYPFFQRYFIHGMTIGAVKG